MIAPSLLLPELARATRRGLDNPNLARQFAQAVRNLPHLTLIPLDHLLARQSVDAAAVYGLRRSDAVYAAVAQCFACTMITLDKQQHDRVKAMLNSYYPAEIFSEI